MGICRLADGFVPLTLSQTAPSVLVVNSTGHHLRPTLQPPRNGGLVLSGSSLIGGVAPIQRLDRAPGSAHLRLRVGVVIGLSKVDAQSEQTQHRQGGERELQVFLEHVNLLAWETIDGSRVVELQGDYRD